MRIQIIASEATVDALPSAAVRQFTRLSAPHDPPCHRADHIIHCRANAWGGWLDRTARHSVELPTFQAVQWIEVHGVLDQL